MMIKIKIKHWSYGGWVEKIIILNNVGELWKSSDGGIILELIEHQEKS